MGHLQRDFLKGSAFGKHVEDVMKQRHVPGFAVAIVDHGEIESQGWGYASVSDQVPCTADTLFDIASASKSMTAASVARLVDHDENYPDVQWNAKVSKLLPGDFVLAEQSYTDSVTVDDMLGHRTGVPSHDLSYMGPQSNEPDSPQSVVQSLRHMPVFAGLREKYAYNNMMYTVATYLVEKKTNKLFPDFLDATFFKPLKMASSHVQPARARAHGLSDRISYGHCWKPATNSYYQFQTPECPEAQGAGSIMTSVNDYILWVKALMNQEEPINGNIYKGMVKCRSLPNPEFEDLYPFHSPISYAAGLETFYYRGHLIVGHDGGVPGFGTYHFWLPERKFGAVLFGNSGTAGEVCEIISRELIDRALEVPVADRWDWTKVVKNYDEERDPGKDLEEARQKLCPGIGSKNEPQEKALEGYTGEFRRPGYRGMKVEIRDGKLFVDASDRSMGFLLHFEHICGQTKYVATMVDCLDFEEAFMRAEFVLDGDRAVRMGLDLETDLDDFIWFDRAFDLPIR